MDRLKKILFAITMVFSAINLLAMDQPDQTKNKKAFYRDLEQGQTSNNDCCHWCRKSINREHKKEYNFKGCLKCKMSFCGRENCPGGIDPFSEQGCRVCLGVCCCCYEDCLEDHNHCFTAKRTYQRHSENDFSWVKNRKKYPEKKSSPKAKKASKKRERLDDGEKPEFKKQKMLPKDSKDSIGGRVVLSRFRAVSQPQSKLYSENCSENGRVNLQLYLIDSVKKNNKNKLDKEVEIPSNEIFLGVEVKNDLIKDDKIEIDLAPHEIFLGIEVKKNLFKSNVRPDLAVITDEQGNLEVEEDPEIAYLEAEIFRALSMRRAALFY